MRTAVLLAALLPLALVACDRDEKAPAPSGDNVSVAVDGDTVADVSTSGNRMEIDIPGLGANLRIPKLSIGGSMDLDGVKLYPGSEVTGMNIRHSEGDAKGGVKMDVHSGGTPDEVAAYYRNAAADAGYVVEPGSSPRFTASKSGGRTIAFAFDPADGGTHGVIAITGKD